MTDNKSFIQNYILPKVKKPITYQGNEVNAVHKDLNQVNVRFAFAFPDTYEIGMSHLGMKILYSLINSIPDYYCERVFAPWLDMESLLRKNNIPLYALETMDSLGDFDFIGFTLQYEMSYTNVLNMLDLAHIPVLAEERSDQDPIIIGGGPCVCNPEPLAPFFDCFVIGEGEEVLMKLLDDYKKAKRNASHFSKSAWLLHIAQTYDGVYVPALYTPTYDQDGKILKFTSNVAGIPAKIKKQFIKDLNHVYYPEELVMPYHESVQDRIPYEIFRGCGRGCRFCQAGMIYRPIRDKSIDCIDQGIQKLLQNTGYDEITLLSLSTSDYPNIEELAETLIQKYENKHITVSLPSLRLDSVSADVVEKLQSARKTSLTFAPEAGTQRLRDVINKNITEENLMQTASNFFNRGWHRIKLYFMLGLPSETEEDIEGIARLAENVLACYDQNEHPKGQRCQITVSTSCFVPKPFTPFQWFGQNTISQFKEKQNILKNRIKNRNIKYNWSEPILSFYEAVLARGDRRLGKVILKAWQAGCKFDSWHECFRQDKWEAAFEASHLDPVFYANRHRETTEILPWDFIDMGVSKSFLINDLKRAQKAAVTPYCRTGCAGCGIMQFDSAWRCHHE
jgi:radical SAM family uncharacterized protein